LTSSAWILWVVPLPGEEEGSEVRVPGLGAIKRDGRVEGPVRKYIGYLNLALCGMLALTGERVLEGKEKPDELVWWMLPGGELLLCVCTFLSSGSMTCVYLLACYVQFHVMGSSLRGTASTFCLVCLFASKRNI
jgi:hypothetical protein